MKTNPSSNVWETEQRGNMSSSIGASGSTHKTTLNSGPGPATKPIPVGKHQGNKSASLNIAGAQKKCDRALPSYPSLERWLLLERIGQGAFSTVYRARDGENEHEEVAVKVLRKFEMDKQQVCIQIHSWCREQKIPFCLPSFYCRKRSNAQLGNDKN